MQGLQPSRPGIQPRATFEGINEGVDACDEHVKQDSPEGQHGEVAEFLADEEGRRVDAIVNPVRQLRGKAVREDQEAEDREQKWWEKPGGCKGVVGIKA
jgi:hypothetical protein